MKDYLLTVDGVNFFWNNAEDRYEAQINGNFYDCDTYKPLSGEGRGLKEVNRNIIAENLYKVENALAILNAERAEDLKQRENVAVNKALSTQQKPFAEVLEEQFTATMAALSVEKMLPSLISAVKDKITAEYGNLPVKHEIIIKDLPPYETTEVLHKEFDDMLKSLMLGKALYLYGEAGTGKSHVAKQLAKALNLPFYCTSSVVDDVQIKGYKDATGNYHETAFFKAFSEGGLFLLDELDASVPETLIILNMALSNGMFDFPCGNVQAHKNFRLVATGNTCGNGADNIYSARYTLDGATMERFLFYACDYDPRIEENLARGDNALLDFIRDYRITAKKAHIVSLATYRAIINLADLSPSIGREKALKVALIKGLSMDDCKLIDNKLTCSNPWREAFKNVLSAGGASID